MAKKKAYEPKKFSSIREMMDMAYAEAGNQIAYKYKNKDEEIVSVSYESFYNRTQYLGAALCELGFGKAHIACIGENSYPWIVAYLTVLQSAGVFVPIDKDLPTAEMLHIINDSESEVIFFDEKREQWMKDNRDKMPNIKLFIGLDKSENDGEFVSAQKLVEHGKTLDLSEFKALKSDEYDLKLLVYTSGTTGVAKGVMLTEHNLVSGVYYGLGVSTPGKVGLSVLPYHHTYEAVCDLLVAIHYHSTLCLNDSIKNVRKNMSLFKPDCIYLVPAFAEAFYRNVKKNIQHQGKEKTFNTGVKLSNALRKVGIDRRRDLFHDIHEAFGGNLQKIVCGGAPIRAEIGEFFDAIGITMLGGYGITECSPLVCVSKEDSKNFETAGSRLACLEWRIDDPNDEGIGEICVKGDVVMKGYYNNPEKTDEVLKDGWFYTGDYGKITRDDELIITGRKKNIIVLTNGKNIYPEEIEGYIQNIEYISEVIVSGIKNEYGQETGLMAEIYPSETKQPEEVSSDVKAALKELPAYKQVSKIILRTEPFTKTTSNKIKRTYL